jgi:hypothetical protein
MLAWSCIRGLRQFGEAIRQHNMSYSMGDHGGVTVTFLRSHVTGSNDAILSEVGRTTDVSLVGMHHGPGMRWDTALGHLLVVPLGNDSLGVWIYMTSQDWQLSSHKGQWRFYDWSLPRSSIMTLGYHNGLHETNAGEHSYGGNSGYLSCLHWVPSRCRKPSGSTL